MQASLASTASELDMTKTLGVSAFVNDDDHRRHRGDSAVSAF
jgi:hypothetical protein